MNLSGIPRQKCRSNDSASLVQEADIITGLTNPLQKGEHLVDFNHTSLDLAPPPSDLTNTNPHMIMPTSSSEPMAHIMRSTCLIAFALTPHRLEREKIEREIYESFVPPYTPRWSQKSQKARTDTPWLTRLSLPSEKPKLTSSFIKSQKTHRPASRNMKTRMTAASVKLQMLIRKARRKTAPQKPKLHHHQADDGRQGMLSHPQAAHDPLQPSHTLTSLEEAQRQLSIGYRSQDAHSVSEFGEGADREQKHWAQVARRTRGRRRKTRQMR